MQCSTSIPASHEHPAIILGQDSVPNGILARILRNVREWDCPLLIKVSLVAIPILLALGFACAYNAILPETHLFRQIIPILSLFLPFIGIYEGIGLFNEGMDQLRREYSPRA